jgi:hypothetical protein
MTRRVRSRVDLDGFGRAARPLRFSGRLGRFIAEVGAPSTLTATSGRVSEAPDQLPWVPHATIANTELEWRELDAQTVEVATPVGSARTAVRLGFDLAGDSVGASIAADWYDAIYTPTLAAIDRLRLGRQYRDAPPGDLFLVLHRHRRDAFPSTGCPHLAQTVVSVIGDGGRRRRLRLPGRGGRSPA